jgi:hypothetical protein
MRDVGTHLRDLIVAALHHEERELGIVRADEVDGLRERRVCAHQYEVIIGFGELQVLDSFDINLPGPDPPEL